MQKSRENWIILGERNTIFYHLSTVRRRARNRIVRLLDQNDVWVENQHALRALIIDNPRNNYLQQSTILNWSELIYLN